MVNIEDIWLGFNDKLRGFIYSKVHDNSIADDILQETFMKIHANINKLKDETKIQSWMYQITRNLIIDHFRLIDKERKKTPIEFDNEEEDTSDGFMTEAMEDMIKMMDELPPLYCEALCLTEIEGISQKEYAKKIDLSYSAAKARVQRARTMLKDGLMKCCHYQFDKYGTVLDIQPAHCCCCSDE